MADEAARRPGVGVGVIVSRGREILLVRRKHHGAGSWAAPGGYLAWGESPEACARREVREETGVQIAKPTFLAISNDIHPDGEKHNVTIWLAGRYASGAATLVAPEELEAVAWFDQDALPAPLYLSTANFLHGHTYPPNVAWRDR